MEQTLAAVALTSLAGAAAYAAVAPRLGGRPTGPRRERIEASPNWRGGKFRNPVPTSMRGTDGGTSLRAMAEFFLPGSERVPSSPVPPETVDPAILGRAGDVALRVHWLGHSSALLEIDGLLLITDPVFGRRVGPVPGVAGPRRFFDPLPITVAALPALDAVLISHDHYDHLEYAAIRALKDRVGAFFAPLGVGAHLERWGVEPERIVELDWWEQATLGPLTMTLAPTRHFSGRSALDGFETLWGAWAIHGPHHRVYFGGDSGYWEGFAEIGERLGPFDLTMLECGAYNEGWAFIHMMPEQTAAAHRDLRGALLMPIHWAKFNLSLHPWTEPVERLLAAAQDPAIHVATPRVGQGFVVGEAVPQEAWWRAER